MSDLESLLSSAHGGQLVANLAARFGLTEEQIDSAIKALAPALEIGLNRAAEEPQVFEKAVGALAGASRYSFFDEPEAAHSQDSVDMGRDLLNDMFGSPAATGQVLQAAARESGVRPDVLGQLLPVLVSVLLSGLTKSINEKGLGDVLGQLANSGALGGILEQILGGGGGARPSPQPMPAPQSGAGGGLGGLLGTILGSLLGGRRAPPPGGGMGPGGGLNPGGGLGRGDMGRADPLDANSGGGLPAGLDQASVQQAIEEIKKTLQIGQNANRPAGQGGGADLEAILGQILGKK